VRLLPSSIGSTETSTIRPGIRRCSSYACFRYVSIDSQHRSSGAELRKRSDIFLRILRYCALDRRSVGRPSADRPRNAREARLFGAIPLL